MKNATFSILLLAALGASFAAGAWHSRRDTVAAAPLHARRILYYVDPMHPAYKADKPGTAPDCGMALQPVYDDDVSAADDAARAGAAIAVSPEQQQLIGVRVGTVEKTRATGTIRLFGRVAPEEPRVYMVVVGTDGYMREVAPVTTGSQVKKNDWLGTFSTPEVRQPIQAFVTTLDVLDRENRNDRDTAAQVAFARTGVEAAVDRLLTLGMSPLQIDEIRRTRVVPPNVRITAPADGFVLARNVSNGQKLEKGTEIFRIADLRRVWILAEAPPADAAEIKAGASALITIHGRPGSIAARVSTDVLPQFDPSTQSTRLRLDADNSGYGLRPDMFVDVEVRVAERAAVTVPADAVVGAGLSNTVFVERQPGLFEPRHVTVGRRAGDRIEIVDGLTIGERIVTSGTFLLDSETRMRAAGSRRIVNHD